MAHFRSRRERSRTARLYVRSGSWARPTLGPEREVRGTYKTRIAATIDLSSHQ
jgi:hypothetical protein